MTVLSLGNVVFLRAQRCLESRIDPQYAEPPAVRSVVVMRQVWEQRKQIIVGGEGAIWFEIWGTAATGWFVLTLANSQWALLNL
ncbi:hypothetical protein C8J56DRAFT_1045754 [Mycena floridula]|nr:hypothetical protein C8J56DRAFT_1045754 [Mycena floridula]